MTTKQLVKLFEKYHDDFLKFEDFKNPYCKRPDLCAFLLLDKLVPGESDIVSAAEHDEIYLDVDMKALAKAATEEDIQGLVRCGVRYSDEYDCLVMFA